MAPKASSGRICSYTATAHAGSAAKERSSASECGLLRYTRQHSDTTSVGTLCDSERSATRQRGRIRRLEAVGLQTGGDCAGIAQIGGKQRVLCTVDRV
jgi:hypothetical protein